MRNILRLLFALSILVMTSCHHQNDTEEERYTERTILLYFPWAGNLYASIQTNISEIEYAITKAGGLNGSRVMVWISKNEKEASLYEIIYSKRDLSCKHDTVERYINPQLNTSEHISSVWRDVQKHARPDGGHYGMIIGCHGNGWISSADWDKYISSNKKLKRIIDAEEAETRWFGVNGKAFQTDIETLSDGMIEAGIHTDFIQFDDCYMANVETAYILSLVTDYLIASPVEMMAYGMPYQRVWTIIANEKPSFQKYVDTFIDFYSQYNTPCGALSVTDCREMEFLAMLMQEAHATQTLSPTQSEDIQVMDGMTPHLFYDFGHYARLLFGSNDVLWQRISSQLDKTVVAKGSTPTFYSRFSKRQHEIKEYSGLTTSEPSTSEMIIEALPHTAWWQRVHGTK